MNGVKGKFKDEGYMGLLTQTLFYRRIVGGELKHLPALLTCIYAMKRTAGRCTEG